MFYARYNPLRLPAAALSATEITPLRQPPRCSTAGCGASSLQHCRLRHPPCCRDPLVLKTKNLALSATFLRLGAAAISLNTDIGSKVQQINCWEAFFRLLRVGEDCQSKKSCRKGEIFVFTLPKRCHWTQRHGTTWRLTRKGNASDRFRHPSHRFLMKLRNVCHISQHGNFHRT